MTDLLRSFRHGGVPCLRALPPLIALRALLLLLLLLAPATLGCGGDDGSPIDATATTGPTGTTGTTTDTEITGSATTDDSSGTTGGWVDECEGIELAQDGVLDLDVPAAEYVVISGQVRLNGGALPTVGGPRGALRFDYTPTVGAPGSVTHVLGASGAENYTIVVPVGAASVHYLPDAGLCAGQPEGPMPCTGGVLIGDLTLAASGVLDLDIPAIVASGAVTQGGAALPGATGERGHLEFVARGGSAGATAAFGATGAASYAIALFPGTYDVAFAGNPELCAEGAAPVPCNRGVILSGLMLAGSGVLDVDIPRVEISGVVTVNGSPIASGPGDRGALRFDPASGGDLAEAGGLVTPPFGATGPVSYALSLVAGTYAIAFVANPGLCTGEVAPTPCVGGPILSSVQLTSSGVLDLKIPRLDLSGKVTLAGANLPDAPGERGAVIFGRGGGDAITVALESTGALTYALSLLPGDYTIAFAANPGLCDGETAPSMPCGGGPLETLDLQTSGVLDLDIPVIKLTGKITLDGGALPNQAADRGSVVFSSGEASVAVALGTGAFGGYAITMMPGTYDLAYAASAMECLGLPDDAMPCGGGRISAGIPLMSSGVLDVEIPAIKISGLVTYGGGPLPSLAAPRGALQWTRAGEGPGPTIDLESTGAKSYSVALVPGRWIVGLAANPGLCDDTIPDFPCTDQMILGCDTP